MRKLEDKVLQLEETNRALELDIMERKQAEQQNKEQFEQLKALHKIDNAINACFELGIILKVLLEQVITHLRVDAAAVLLINPSLLTLRYAAGSGFRTRAIERTEVRIGSSAAGRVAIERRTLQFTELPVSQADKNFLALWEQEGFKKYVGAPLIAKGQVKGVLEIYHRNPLELEPEQVGFLETLGGQAAIAIDNSQLFERMQNANFDLILAYDATIEGWSRAMDMRDKETEGHTQQVTELTLKLAARMGVSEQEQIHIRRGALLHDIGKLGVPDHVLLKPGPLTDEEWVIMRQHPVHAFNMLMPIAYLRPALDIPYCHHEKWDGTGYPRGLKGEQIPFPARIFAVVDVWDALRSDRPYRKAWPREKVLDHIRSASGKHFDPEVVDVFLGTIGEYEIPAR